MTKQNKPDRLAKLLKHWDRATAEEKAIFLLRVAGTSLDGKRDAAQPVLPFHPCAEGGRYLTPDTKARVEALMRRRGITPHAVMHEMGFSPKDKSLALALARGSALRLKVIQALEGWLQHQEDQSTRNRLPGR